MTIIVEDGSIVTGANSYVTEAEYEAYWTLRGTDETAATDVEARLIQAMDYLNNKYRQRWKGLRATSAQPQSFPRKGLYDEEDYLVGDTAIPQQLKDAQCEAAFLAKSETLQPAFKRGGAVVRKKVGPLETEYSASAPAETKYTVIDGLLSGLITSSNVIQLERA